jgi:hypothetical protein
VQVFPRSALVSAGLAAAFGLAATALAGGNVNVIVLKEHAVGSTSTAQPYLDKLMEITAKENGWSGSAGKFFTKRGDADGWIASDKPSYGIVSLGAFLEYKNKHKVEAIGEAIVAQGGGQQYFLISKSAADANGCKGKKLASDHADDPTFIDKVVSGGAFKLGDFTVEKTTRPVQTIKKVANDEADCALIDDAQLAELGKMGAAGVKQVWASAKLPSMIVVSFPSAPAAESKAFQASLPKICSGAGAQVCKDVGLQSLTSAAPGSLAGIIAAYNK